MDLPAKLYVFLLPDIWLIVFNPAELPMTAVWKQYPLLRRSYARSRRQRTHCRVTSSISHKQVVYDVAVIALIFALVMRQQNNFTVGC